MKDLAVYCAKAWRISTWLTTGAWPITSPPLTSQTLDMGALKAKLVYIRLHGIDGQPFLYGDPGWDTALTAEQVAEADFDGCHIFLEGCNGNEMADAFLAAGALSVTGNNLSTYGRRWHIGPSSKVGAAWIAQMRRGETDEALKKGLDRVPDRYKAGWTVRKKK